MEKLNLLTLALVTLVSFSACSSDDNDIKGDGGNSGSVLNGDTMGGKLTQDLTLESGKSYKLSGVLRVPEGRILTIESGVTITAIADNTIDYILVEQGGKINAVGTASAPIVMTSEDTESGAWGGVHICGKAPINITGGTSTSEVGDAVYGGDDEADNSGTMKYVRLEYTGVALDNSGEKESNGLTLYGVGNGTTIEYVQAYMGKDDGFEWFGGTVNAKYLVSTGSGDDSFDWTYGWVGNGSYWVAKQINGVGDCLIEADNNSNTPAATPASFPTLDYLTLIGSANKDKGIRLRAGTKANINNALVIGQKSSVCVETDETENSLESGESILKNILCTGAFVSKEKIYTEAMFTVDNKINQTITLDGYVGMVDGAGAVATGSDWTAGWTR